MTDDVGDGNEIENIRFDPDDKQVKLAIWSIAISLKRLADCEEAKLTLMKQSQRQNRQAIDTQLKLSERAQRDIARMERRNK